MNKKLLCAILVLVGYIALVIGSTMILWYNDTTTEHFNRDGLMGGAILLAIGFCLLFGSLIAIVRSITTWRT